MFYANEDLFSERDVKTETITVRLTAGQKNAIITMANSKSVSAYLLNLVKEESRRVTESQQFMRVIDCDYNNTDDEHLPY